MIKKHAALILALLLLLTACGTEKAPADVQSTAAATTSAPETTGVTQPTEPEISMLYLLETEVGCSEDGTVGYIYTYAYDDQGRELGYTWYAGGTGKTTRYENIYDDQGRFLGYTIFRPDGTEELVEKYIYHDEEGYRESYNPLAAFTVNGTYEDREYLDEQGRVIRQETYLNGERIAVYEFNSAGEYLWRENSQVKEVYERDGQGNTVRMVSTSKLDGSETVTLYTNTYDEENRLILTVTSKAGEDTQKMEYLYEDGTTTETRTFLKDVWGVTDLLYAAGDTLTNICDYDENGNLIRKETLVNGQSDGYVEYTYIALELPGES